MLRLCEVGEVRELQPAVLYEKDAARYLRLGIHEFRALVYQDKIPCRNHENGKRRIYLRVDLDNYLIALPRCKIDPAKIRPAVQLNRKEAQ